MLGEIALLFILVGLAIQLYSVWHLERSINPWFLIFYAPGVILLVIDGILAGAPLIAGLHFACFVLAALILLKVTTKSVMF